MDSRLATLLLGAISGAAVASLLLVTWFRLPEHTQQVEQLQAQAAVSSNQIAELEEELSGARRQLSKLASKNLELVGGGRDLPKPTVPPAASSEGEKQGTNRMQEAMTLLKQANTDLQVEGRLLQLKNRLQLTPEQQARARELLASRFAAAGRVSDFNLGFSTILTPEQQASWQQMQRDDQQNRTEGDAWTSAAMELDTMQLALGLSAEQQQKALPVLYQRALEEREAGDRKESDVPNWPIRLERELDGLKEVLTDEQLAIYQKFRQQTLKSSQMMFEEGP
ncbi:MAG: hypothetical protein ACLQU3_00200 [Limisphaerales bacterium]